MEIQYSQLKINHLNDTPSTKAAGGGIISGVFQQGRQGTSQGQEDFELSWYLFFQQYGDSSVCKFSDFDRTLSLIEGRLPDKGELPNASA